MAQDYPRRHTNDLYNAPPWVFLPSISVGSPKAAEMLNISRNRFLRLVDSLGLTVLRDPRERRYFLLTEIQDLKEALAHVTVADVMKHLKGNGNAIVKKRKKTR